MGIANVIEVINGPLRKVVPKTVAC